MKKNSFKNWLTSYGEFVIYFLILAWMVWWQWQVYNKVEKIYQDIVIASYALQALNVTLSLLTARRLRLLAQILLLSAILFGAVVIYYLRVIITSSNVI
ncbi:hypothetical protein KBB60_01150 [Patescibacteria group bacterium]|jgi:hypothetical protein|nr:hypothetical protein [Patescibacteria group bacterium]